MPVLTLAILEKRVPYSKRYLVLGLVGLLGLGLPLQLQLGLVALALWFMSRIALNKYCCENGTLNSNVCHNFLNARHKKPVYPPSTIENYM